MIDYDGKEYRMDEEERNKLLLGLRNKGLTCGLNNTEPLLDLDRRNLHPERYGWARIYQAYLEACGGLDFPHV